METKIATLATLDTLYGADSVEWCPQKPAFFACGTYQLVEGVEKTSKTNTRVGSIMLLNFDYATRVISQLHKVPTTAITDMKWCRHLINGRPALATTGSAGDIALYTLNETGRQLETVTNHDFCSPEFSLSLDWSCNNANTDAEQKVVVSDTGGNISELKLTGNGAMFEVLQTWKAHMAEVWITAYDCWDPCTVYSGGDDCKLKGWDTRTSCDKPTFVKKTHMMGVCSIQSNPHKENMFASGSYDEQLCVWDRRSMKEPLATCGVEGGIWRIKWHPEKANYILTACCHSGFHVLKLDGAQRALGIIGSYTGHESLAYGAAWGRKVLDRHSDVGTDDDSLHEVIGTCSFYDHSLHMWELMYNKPAN